MQNNMRRLIEDAMQSRLISMSYLPGGSVGEVWKLVLEAGKQAVAKTANHGDTLDIEGFMLSYLKENTNLPIPEVHLARPDLLIIGWIENDSRRSPKSDEEAARHLFDLHEISNNSFGFNRDTLIGPLPQPNSETKSWIEFFRDHRLLYMAKEALDYGNLNSQVMTKVETLAGKLDHFVTEPKQPSLLHGDIWGGNVLYQGGHLAGFIDPAIYYGHREIELAYTTLFHTFGSRFFDAYNEVYQLDKDFFETRISIYHLYPLLVHARLFGGSYIQETEAILDQFI